MTYYSNSNQIKELMMQIVEEKVEPLNALKTVKRDRVHFSQSL